jgi:copper chaperone NosL
MTTRTRLLLALAALLLTATYMLPLWHIGLQAPQYPEGRGLSISIDGVTGQNPHDLQSLNGLNHYIGMHKIVPEEIPELRFLPVAIGVLTALGLLAAAIGRRWALTTYAAILVSGALAGLADFWWWGYRYGHELDPRAAIRVPGMTYQPPLIGSKQLLNITAHSWPASGGWILTVAVTMVVLLTVLAWKRPRPVAA